MSVLPLPSLVVLDRLVLILADEECQKRQILEEEGWTELANGVSEFVWALLELSEPTKNQSPELHAWITALYLLVDETVAMPTQPEIVEMRTFTLPSSIAQTSEGDNYKAVRHSTDLDYLHQLDRRVTLRDAQKQRLLLEGDAACLKANDALGKHHVIPMREEAAKFREWLRNSLGCVPPAAERILQHLTDNVEAALVGSDEDRIRKRKVWNQVTTHAAEKANLMGLVEWQPRAAMVKRALMRLEEWDRFRMDEILMEEREMIQKCRKTLEQWLKVAGEWEWECTRADHIDKLAKQQTQLLALQHAKIMKEFEISNAEFQQRVAELDKQAKKRQLKAKKMAQKRWELAERIASDWVPAPGEEEEDSVHTPSTSSLEDEPPARREPLVVPDGEPVSTFTFIAHHAHQPGVNVNFMSM
eukprot:NODE_127_length_1450_cov_462.250945_g123_i0.p1 GENE.NODE_127_length_1450_cov_462.250945_g123_i0~~NODE_127_length_1450_cov_462.250945_g123_i0.p1  ORF type:complete len:416 (-),score=95.72 NODE_127_length_1450_cov_462.250945_g123_i0:110-1357(-)